MFFVTSCTRDLSYATPEPLFVRFVTALRLKCFYPGSRYSLTVSSYDLFVTWLLMKLESNTTVASLVSALPSAVVVFSRFGIPTTGSDSRTVQEVCSQYHVRCEDFLRAIEQLDWDGESPLTSNHKGT